MDNVWLEKYNEFINEHRIIGKVDYYTEKHHIKPRALFPDLAKDRSNIVKLSGKDHIKAHYYLYKAYDCMETTMSLNMMINRGKYNPYFDYTTLEECFDDYANEYEEFRMKVAKIISETNSGRKLTPEHIERMRNSIIGKVVVKDKNGIIQYVSVDDERYKSGELVYYRVGYKHTEETKQRMSENGIKGLTAYTDGIKTVYSNEAPHGFVKGLSPVTKERISESLQNFGYATNVETGETIRLNKNEPLPDGFIWKREKKGGFKGWDEINKDYVRVYNIKTGFYGMKKQDELDWGTDILAFGLSTDFKVVIIDNMIYYNMKSFKKFLWDNYNIILPQKIGRTITSFVNSAIDYVIKTNMSRNGNKLKDYNGKKIGDLFNFSIVKMEDIVYNDKMIICHDERMRAKYGYRI